MAIKVIDSRQHGVNMVPVKEVPAGTTIEGSYNSNTGKYIGVVIEPADLRNPFTPVKVFLFKENTIINIPGDNLVQKLECELIIMGNLL